jgi:hypothetical protein
MMGMVDVVNAGDLLAIDPAAGGIVSFVLCVCMFVTWELISF